MHGMEAKTAKSISRGSPPFSSTTEELSAKSKRERMGVWEEGGCALYFFCQSGLSWGGGRKRCGY